MRGGIERTEREVCRNAATVGECGTGESHMSLLQGRMHRAGTQVRANSSHLRFLPMRRNGLVEIRQRFDALLPTLQLGWQEAVGVEIRQLDAAAVHERDHRVE